MLDDDDAARPALDESLALARDAQDNSIEARALLLLGNLANRQEPAVALEHLERSLAAAKLAGDSWCVAHALALAGWAQMLLGDFVSSRQTLGHCLCVARLNRDHQSWCIGHYMLASLSLIDGHAVTVEGLLQQALLSARALRDPYAISSALDLFGSIQLRKRDIRGSRALFEEGLAVSRTAGLVDVSLQLSGLGMIALVNDDLGAARDRFLEAARTARSDHPNKHSAYGLGLVALREADFAAARRHFEEMVACSSEACALDSRSLGLDGLAYVALSQGDVANATRLVLSALDLRHDYDEDVVESLEALAIIAGKRRRFPQAARIIGAAKALRQARSYGAVRIPWHQHGLHEIIEALGKPRFEALLAEGGQLSVAQAVAFARQAVEGNAPPRTEWGCLTTAERRVASLAAAGLSNPQIAARQSISRNTVEHHMTRILAKLEIASRTHLASSLASGLEAAPAPPAWRS
jgi:DNA-binding CsgD family transcriptional regulator